MGKNKILDRLKQKYKVVNQNNGIYTIQEKGAGEKDAIMFVSCDLGVDYHPGYNDDFDDWNRGNESGEFSNMAELERYCDKKFKSKIPCDSNQLEFNFSKD